VLRTWRRKIERFVRDGVVFDGEVLKASLRESIGDVTFLEAYARSARVLNVAVSSTSMYDMPCLLNYVTAPHVLVWSAVVASCALPAFFASAPLLARDDVTGAVVPWEVTGGDRWIDGSVENDLPMRRVAELFNVNHFIVSQVNPHIYPFLRRHALDAGRDAAGRPLGPRRWASRLAFAALALVRSELCHRLAQLAALGVAPRACAVVRGVLSQKYHGDITVVPEMRWTDLAHVFADRPRAALREAVALGARATWPKVGLIRARVAAELAIDEALISLRDRLVSLEAGASSECFPPTDDPMIDPDVNIARHVSPALGLRSTPSLPELAFAQSAATMRRFAQSTDF
jgi:TAG lipase/steryl ester hydrolase/phospholipase A2/LPA acyltransferase